MSKPATTQRDSQQLNTGLSNMGKSSTGLWIPAQAWRAPIYFGLVFITTLFATGKMWEVMSTNQTSVIECIIVLLFALCFFWIAMAFWTSIIGFGLLMLKRDPISLQPRPRRSASAKKAFIHTRTALIMPIYNEEVSRVMAGIEATLTSLAATDQDPHFDFYILSDTTNAAIATHEEAAWQRLRQRLKHSATNIFYRRRTKNSYRKVGNIADFCQRWGNHYDYMVVLDADSIMSGDTLVRMVTTMQKTPTLGLLQTIPIPVRQHTFFGRFLQFASELHTPVLAIGNSFWQTDTGNYWGHNAIIRIDAFIKCCNLPHLSGNPPFGGEILSHDFVEAALLKRGGWQVVTLTETVASFEEVPSNIIDYIIRDRRWSQGNLQHLRLLQVKGLHSLSRFHLFSGAMAYIASLLWLIMLALGTGEAILQALNSNQFFSEPYQLFPNWHIAKPELIYSLLGTTLLFLFMPKILSLLAAMLLNTRTYGGRSKLLMSAIIEATIAIVIAPVMMIFHAYFVISIVLGSQVSWKTQERNGRAIPWREAARHTLLVSMGAVIWGGICYLYAPRYFWWLLPVLTGLILAAPIIRYSSSIWLGQFARRLGLFSVVSESKKHQVVAAVSMCEKHYLMEPTNLTATLGQVTTVINPESVKTPVEKWIKMPIQQL